MSRREDLDNAIWSDPEFEALSAHATLLYIWSFTNPRCGMSGAYKVSVRAMSESKVPEAEIPAVLAELEEARFAFYEGHVLWVRSRVKHLRSRSWQIAKAVANDLAKLPIDHVLRTRFVAEYGSDGWLRDELRRIQVGPIDDPSEKPIGKGDSDTPSMTHRGPSGKGQGLSSTRVTSTDEERQVFEAWLESTGRTTRTLFDAKRRRIVRNALKAYPLQDVIDAVRGWRYSPHHRGENSSGTVYNDLELLLRDARNIEKFRDLERRGPSNGHAPALARSRVVSDENDWKRHYPTEAA